MEEMRNAYNILVGKSEWKRPVGRRSHWWEDNVKIDLREIGWDYVDWIHLTQDGEQWRPFVNTVMNHRIP